MAEVDISTILQLIQIAAIIIGGVWALRTVDARFATAIAVIQNEVKHLWEEVNEVKGILSSERDKWRRRK